MKRSALLSVSLISIFAGLMLPILSVAQQDSGQQDPAKQEPPKKTTKLDFQKDIVPIVKAKDGTMSDKDREKFLEWVDAKIPTPARRGGGGNGGGN
jgi:hypothetical protein